MICGLIDAASDATGRTFLNNSPEMLRFPIRVGWSVNVSFAHVWILFFFIPSKYMGP